MEDQKRGWKERSERKREGRRQESGWKEERGEDEARKGRGREDKTNRQGKRTYIQGRWKLERHKQSDIQEERKRDGKGAHNIKTK